jgi:hypothetical protein
MYLGDYQNSSIILITQDSDTPVDVDLDSKPICGLLMNDDNLLIVSCENKTIKVI